MKNKELKRKKLREIGITLVALVVTIIILLILAGVTLNLALGEGGIFARAKNTADRYQATQDNELEQMSGLENAIDKYASNQPKEERSLVSTVKDTEHEDNVKVQDSLGNPVVIPGGFKFAGEDTDTVEDGIIIEDDEGNQFVWIPVSNINGNNDGTGKGLIKKEDETTVEITLGRYTFDKTPGLKQRGSERASDISNGSYKENTNLDGTNGRKGGEGAKSLEDFVTSVEENHGYYLARYEASYKSGTNADDYKIFTKQSESCSTSSWSNTPGRLWNYITQEDASKASQNMYNEGDNEANYIESDLVNSYAWDTAIVFIEKMGNVNYATSKSSNSGLMNTGVTGDNKCNIFDMAGNLEEWTTEYCTATKPCVLRGGNYRYGYCTANHNSGIANSSYLDVGFRPLLYLK